VRGERRRRGSVPEVSFLLLTPYSLLLTPYVLGLLACPEQCSRCRGRTHGERTPEGDSHCPFDD